MTDGIATYAWPGQTQFGFGAARLAGAEAKRLDATTAFILTDPGVRGAGLLEPVIDSLTGSGIGHVIYDHCPPNPDIESVDSAAAAFRESRANLIIGVGGGSPIDAAKAVRELAGGPLDASIAEYMLILGDKCRPVPQVRDMPPMIGIPTTAGTGAELTPWGVITDTANKQKTGIGGINVIPTTALIDPQLTMTMPAWLTAATGMDALSHLIEAYVSTNALPSALDPMILFGIELIGRSLPVAVHQPDNRQARYEVMQAAMIGGVAISSRWLGAAHSLAHQLSTFANVHHGLACSLMLPPQMAYSLPAAPERYARIATALDPGYTGPETTRQRAERAVEAVRRLASDCGLPVRLRDAGVDEAVIDEMVPYAYKDLNWTTNPRLVSRGDLEMMYRQVY